MNQRCNHCGCVLNGETLFCPECGAPLSGVEAQQESISQLLYPDEQPREESHAPQKERANEEIRRVFGLKEHRYGDTGEYDDMKIEKKPRAARKTSPAAEGRNVSLYLSVISLILSLVAIVLVIIFVIIPGGKKNSAPAAIASGVFPTETEPQAPTDPPLVGDYRLVNISGRNIRNAESLLSGVTMTVNADFTGAMYFYGVPSSELVFDHSADIVTVDGVEHNYTFDGTWLTISTEGSTMTFEKN